MAEYIDREALLRSPIRIDNYDKENGNENFVFGIETVLEYAEHIPTADVVEVVRCKDCKEYNTHSCAEGFGWCEMWDLGKTDNQFAAMENVLICGVISGER